MRERLRPLRARAMARRPDGRRRPSLSPRARWIAGWVAAIVIIALVAGFVRLLGGNADGTAILPSDTPSPGIGDPAAIRFGTALDPTTGEVSDQAETDRFVESDAFAYSYRPPEPPPTTVWVEVRRGANGDGEAVQAPAPHGLAADARVIAFEVPAAALFRDFGTGPFQMRIYLVEDESPAAVGTFELIEPAPTTSP
jgi:hypothetical protein